MTDRPGAGPPAIAQGGERRFVTVVFCDMVGSTALSERLDPEEFRDLLLVFRETCSGVVARFGGFLARYLGDALLIYFGFPQAHDRDAQLAVSSALGIVRAVRKLRASLPEDIAGRFGVHIGIHTGLVIAGELVSESTREISAIVGETPNIAARLQTLAPADSIYISRATYDLVADYFDCRSLGIVPIAGLSRPLEGFEVVADRGVRGRLELLNAGRRSTLCGRASELAVLLSRWQQVKEGHGQVVLIGGEPGIGKSRLVQALDEKLGNDRRTVLLAYCASHATDSALFPVIDLLRGQAEIGPDMPPAAQRDKLAAFAQARGLPDDSVAHLATLLSIPLHPASGRSPAGQRKRTLEILTEYLLMQAERQPTIFVLEDAHWADASTIEFMNLLVNHVATAALMVILTFRPEFEPTGMSRSHVTHLTLDRLAAAEVESLIDSVTTGRSLPHPVLHEVIAKTDGVPLFVEELTKMVIESGALRAEGDRYRLAEPLPPLGIPATLRESLMARLDGLTHCKALAQLAATLGREFSYALLRAVSGLREDELDHCLTRLVEAEVFYQKGLPPRSSYVFKHSLIQETAYQSLLLSRRKHTHALIARTIEASFPEIANTQLELIAHHFTRAGEVPKAVEYYRRAGRRALDQSANIEAVAHLTKGLDLLGALPASPERDETEVQLLLMLGAAQIATRGYAAAEAGRAYTRARELAQRGAGSAAAHAAVLRGLQAYYQVRGPLRVSRELSEEFLKLAEGTGDRLLRVEARRRLGWALFCLGEMEGGRSELEASLALYDPALAPRHIAEYGSDPAAIGGVNLAWLEWCTGRVEAARQRSAEAIQHARRLGHSLSLAYALGMSAAVHQCLGRPAETHELAAETLALAEHKEIAYWAAWSTVLHGWAMASEGEVDEGIARMQGGIDAYRSTGAELFRPYSLSLLAAVLAGAGREVEALGHIEQALASAHETDARFVEAELFRLRGEVRLQIDPADAAAVDDLDQAIAIAGRQGSAMFELRAAVTLATSGPDRRRDDARSRLATLCGRLGGPSDNGDLARARAALGAAPRLGNIAAASTTLVIGLTENATDAQATSPRVS